MAGVTVGVGVGACIGRLHEHGETCLLIAVKATKRLSLGAWPQTPVTPIILLRVGRKTMIKVSLLGGRGVLALQS